jgi:hypothetical protein
MAPLAGQPTYESSNAPESKRTRPSFPSMPNGLEPILLWNGVFGILPQPEAGEGAAERTSNSQT